MNSKQQGFTIVELIIALTVFSLALVIALTGFITVVRIYRNSLAQRDSQVYARAVMDTIVRDARSAKSVEVVTNPSNTNLDDFCLDFGGSKERYFANISGTPPTFAFGKVQYASAAVCAVNSASGLAGDVVGTLQYVTSYPKVSLTQIKITPIVSSGKQIGMQITETVAYKPGSSLLDVAQTSCTPGPGSEFCATTTLTSSVTFLGGNL
jgi:prepilin-type N-terminal cleavage/methylation domain-containing protein